MYNKSASLYNTSGAITLAGSVDRRSLSFLYLAQELSPARLEKFRRVDGQAVLCPSEGDEEGFDLLGGHHIPAFNKRNSARFLPIMMAVVRAWLTLPDTKQ